MEADIRGTYIPKREEDIEPLLKKYIADVTRSDGTIYDKETVRHKRIHIPDTFRNKTEERLFWREQIRRCREGYEGLAPAMYFYFNFCKILTPQGKKVRPEAFRTQNKFCWWAENRLRGKKKGRGIILLKRRRWGFSWLAEALLLHEAIFYKYSYIGQQSKSEDDVIKLFDKMKFIYNELPDQLRPEYLNFSRKKIFFARKVGEGNQKKIAGNQSIIECKTATDTSWEGSGMKIFYSDESGKIPNIGRVWRMTEPALAGADGFSREGLAILGGTAGDVDKDAWEFVELWDDNEMHKLDRFFVPGWANRFTDDFGNEDVEKGVRDILRERWLRVNSQKDLYAYIQQYPLTPEEALLGGESPCFDIKSINSQMRLLQEDPPTLQRGFFQWMVEGETVRFIPDHEGAVQILEHPKETSHYLGGCDPVDHSGGEGSWQATFIMKMSSDLTKEQREKIANELSEKATTAERISAYLKIGKLPVMMIHDNPADPAHFWEQSLMAAIYYSKKSVCKLHIERNRPGMIGWFAQNGYRGYLHKRTSSLTKIKGQSLKEYGDHMNEDNKNHRTSLIDRYIRVSVGKIFFYELLKHMKEYNPDLQRKKFDTVDAFGMCLMKAADKKLRFTAGSEEAIKRMPNYRYVKRNGRIVLEKG